jgi:hypothetical protein
VTITGGYAGVAGSSVNVTFDTVTVSCAAVTGSSLITISCKTPYENKNVVDIIVTLPDGSIVTFPNAFTFN